MASIRTFSRSFAAIVGLTCTCVTISGQPATGSRYMLMPVPAQIEPGAGEFTLAPPLSASLPQNASSRLASAVNRTIARLGAKAGVALAGAMSPGAPGQITVAVQSDGPAVQDVDEDESYSLVSTPTSIRIEAGTTLGALHALETLVQLAQPSGDHYVIPSVSIHDVPRFHWRGLMIDCGRHFEPINVLKRNLDAMAAVKLNVFHWHLTEDQGFRIESKLFPNLTKVGSDGLFYTQEQARDLVAYARARGIRVVPEFEMPGHSTAWLLAYPELASGSKPEGIRREFGISDFAIDPTREETYRFIEKFLREMTTIFPDKYVHIGGDETPAPDWKQNPQILKFMQAHGLKTNADLQAYFNQRILKILAKLDRRMVGWDEILNPALPKDVVIQSWRGEAALAQGAQQGYQGVLSAPYYLNTMKPAGVYYLADPLPPGSPLTPDQQKLILGGEVCMWGEHINQYTIDATMWPRTAAIAERFWSPATVDNVDDMYRRLPAIAIEVESLGLRNITSEDAGLREIAGSKDINALRTVAEAFEPVPFGVRAHIQRTNQFTPLTNFVDAVRPDPPSRQKLEIATRELLANPADSDAIAVLTHFYDGVATALPEVNGMVASAPRLVPLKQRLDQLAVLVKVGQEGVRLLKTNQPAPAEWKTASLQAIEDARKPSALVNFVFLDSLADLVKAAK